MKSILIPVDFSAASKGAVQYSVHWAEQYSYDQIILFKVHYESFMDYISTLGVGYSFMGKDASTRYRKDSKKLLKELQKIALRTLSKNSNITVRMATSDLPLTRAVIKMIERQNSIELVVLGSDHTRQGEPGFITSNIIKIARTSPVKLLIVPEGYQYAPINRIIVPCDLQHMMRLGKLEQYSSMLGRLSELTILNIYNHPDQQNSEMVLEWRRRLQGIFKDRQLQLYHVFDRDTLRGVLDFVSDHPTDLIVALPGEHSFLYYLASKSLSEGIYRNTSQSVLLLK